MEKKTSKNVLLAVMGVLIIVEIVARVAIIQISTFAAVTQLISLVFVALYGFVLYKKPHGNMLKYAMLLFAFGTIAASCYHLLVGSNKIQIVKILASAAVCYCAGRLNRIDQNKYLLPIIGIVFCAVSVIEVCKFYAIAPNEYLLLFSCFNFTISYITLMIAYFVRFEEHKLAGIMDTPKD